MPRSRSPSAGHGRCGGTRAAATARPRKPALKERNELEAIESVILAAEREVEAIESRLNDPVFQTTRFAEVPAAVQQPDAAKAEVAALYQRWETLETLRESAEASG